MEAHLVRAEQAQLATGWTRERVDLVKRTVCPKGITDDAFALFMEQCKRSGLDPLLKEAFCVPRGGQHVFQPSEAGMLARAERFPDFKGIQASAVYAEDEIIVDQGKGEVVHRFNPAKRKGELVGAWARVVRDGKLPVVVWLDFAGYVQKSNELWGKIPTTMIEKCARVSALRKAYPEAFGGLYIREEMPPDGLDDSTPTPVQATHLPSKEQSHARHPPPASDAPGAQATKDSLKEGPLVGFGPHASKPLAELTPKEARECLELAAKNIAAKPGMRWEGAVRQTMKDIASRQALLSHEDLGGMLDTANATEARPTDNFSRDAARVLRSVLEPEAERRALAATNRAAELAKPQSEDDVPF